MGLTLFSPFPPICCNKKFPRTSFQEVLLFFIYPFFSSAMYYSESIAPFTSDLWSSHHTTCPATRVDIYPNGLAWNGMPCMYIRAYTDTIPPPPYKNDGKTTQKKREPPPPSCGPSRVRHSLSPHATLLLVLSPSPPKLTTHNRHQKTSSAPKNPGTQTPSSLLLLAIDRSIYPFIHPSIH